MLLSVVCVLAVLHRRKRSSKAVMPRPEKEDKMEVKEDGRSSPTSPGLCEKTDFTGNKHWDSEMGRRRPFTGVRAKSANALLFTSPFSVSGKDQATLQTEIETSSKDTENPSEGKQTPGNECETAGGVQAENISDSTDVRKKNEKQALDENTHFVSVSTETAPYLSIGTNQDEPSLEDFNMQSADSQGQRSQTGKMMARISTWPPTAVQWQERCNMKEQEEERVDDGFRFPGEGKKVQSKMEKPSFFDKQGVKAEQTEEVTAEKTSDHVTNCCEAHNQTDLRQEEGIQDQRLNLEQVKPAENLAQKFTSKSSNKGELRHEQRQSRQRAENRSTSLRAPSGGASPDDETLLHGNEYAFMDLLHEVVQNNGRWTRERWKQVNKQRHNQQGQ